MPAPPEATAKTADGKSSGPAARLEAHAAKKKSKDMRKHKTPGPGSYTPGQHSKKLGEGKPTSSFTSKTKRMDVTNSSGSLDNSGDPGSYDPYTLQELASTSKKSFAKSLRSGTGGFGTREGRELNIETMGESTPGPGAYNGDAMMRSGKKANLAALDSGEKMPSSSFKSLTAKFPKQHNEQVPGAGAYSPKHTAVEHTLAQNPAHSMKAQGTRFVKVRQVTPEMVGPGAYEAQHEGSLASEVKKSVSKASRANPGFGTLMPAHELPFLDEVQDAMDMPGPGAYEQQKSSLEASGHRSAFKSQSKRVDVTNSSSSLDASGDPGSYDPYTLQELASTSKKSFGRSMRAGMGDFGTRERRELNIETMGESTPGPGAYNGDVMMRSGKKANLAALDSGEKMPSSSFKSLTAKFPKQHNEQVPGAGAYSPKHTAVEHTLAQNPAHSMKAQGTRFKSGDSWERAQASEPGPGAYETEILRTGGRSALSAYDTGEQMPSAAFQSDAIRQLPWPDAPTAKAA